MIKNNKYMDGNGNTNAYNEVVEEMVVETLAAFDHFGTKNILIYYPSDSSWHLYLACNHYMMMQRYDGKVNVGKVAKEYDNFFDELAKQLLYYGIAVKSYGHDYLFYKTDLISKLVKEFVSEVRSLEANEAKFVPHDLNNYCGRKAYCYFVWQDGDVFKYKITSIECSEVNLVSFAQGISFRALKAVCEDNGIHVEHGDNFDELKISK